MKTILSKLFVNQNEIVTQIHNEFDNAQENLLNQAKEIINQNNVRMLAQKAETLKKLGFVNTPMVKKYNKKENIMVKNMEQAALINHYKYNYPFLKFLTESELDRICKKYNLIYAPVERYTQDVPEKNMHEIENAQPLSEKDKAKDLYKHEITAWYNRSSENLIRFLKKNPLISEEWNIDRNDEDEFINHAEKLGFKDVHKHKLSLSDTKRTIIHKQGLFIAAPKSHFNLKGLKQNKLGFFNMEIVKINDPIVFRYCRGGIQVLSKWGLEASDEALVNEINN